MKWSRSWPFLLLLVVVSFSGCISTMQGVPKEEQTSSAQQGVEEKASQETVQPVAPEAVETKGSAPVPRPDKRAAEESVEGPSPPTEAQEEVAGEEPRPFPVAEKPASQEETKTPPSPPPQEVTNQELLDSALDYCQVSNDFWERGDLDSAINALDKAYSLILRVQSDDDPKVLQQKEDLRFTISKRIIEVYASRATVVNGEHNAIPLTMNRHVKNALMLLKGKERRFFLEAYRRSGRYRPAIVKALREAGLPEELSWLPLIESGFKIRAFSRARALGLWQFIASTGYKFGLKRDYWVDERMDPEKSTRAAIAYLKELHRIFGDWTTVLAAYNCGEGTVLKRIRNQRINYLDNFWDLYETLPRETAFYVPKFLALLHILKEPAEHGFDLPPVEEEIKTEKVTINKQVHLKSVAGLLGIREKVLYDINAELRRRVTPPDAPYSLHVPEGKGRILLAKLDQIPLWRPPVPAYVIHRVRPGESLSVIATRYGSSVRAIMVANGLRSQHFIRAGWRLKIPTKRTARAYLDTTPVQTSSLKGKKIVRYRVRNGDSLWLIARRFNTTTKVIVSLNNLRSSFLRVGQTLKIPVREETRQVAGGTGTYMVRKGDSPYLIAETHNMSLSELLRLNNLTPRSTIYPGQILKIKPR
ncbi:MAG: LysM peptidoglycan-binding domain-containing protein [Deltaproteobacteria bacterium]|nr:LysM peptidoglycan-binding domain-containing protein [Deltaproteobacteria bacterium]